MCKSDTATIRTNLICSFCFFGAAAAAATTTTKHTTHTHEEAVYHSQLLVIKLRNMDCQSGLPLHTGPVDHFRYGFESMETQMTQSNPVMAFEKNVRELATMLLLF
jgi:hypothetical protein